MLKKIVSASISVLHSWQRPALFAMGNSMTIHQQKSWCSSDNYDNLGKHMSQEEVSDTDTVAESEVMYFTNEPKKLEQRKLPGKDGIRPVKYSLAATNKMLFGPLLETKVEKRRRLKREEKGISEEEYQEKQKKKKKGKHEKKSRTKKKEVDPLIRRPENAHYFGGVNDDGLSPEADTSRLPDEILADDFQVRDDTAFSNDSDKLFSIKKLPKYSYRFSYDAQGAQTKSRTKKIIIIQGQDSKASAETHMEDEENGIKETENQTLESINIDTSNTSSGVSSSTLVTIDNSTFTAVPTILDIGEIQNFPLFSSDIRSHEPQIDSSLETITTIGMFDGGYQRLPSVRKILDATMPLPNRIALEKWKAKMIKELGEEGFNKYRQELLDRGKLLHGCIQSELSGMTLSSDQTLAVSGFWTSVRHVIPNVSDVQVLESRIIHPYLYYQGAVDCVGSYKGMPILIEWKTSGKPKLSVKSMFDDPLQVVAYLGALNFDGNYRLQQPIESAMLVVAYETGLPAHIHILNKNDCEHYWRMWCTRLSQFWSQLAANPA
ncbi:uncharacterized protein LOC125028045 [Penaeus chinensis]|uniref:uncharacterized protein LOC125028045 n=1 Tax=Penaeus chinensis TaxID=139456 RepID=UPI001FB71A41|nr:uncharacterized protein LOC125028045 [Penaeus chinensis]XP_047473281.1 uncharacterized protein LOC125028045 [Penaeus chinensis]